MAAHIYPIAQSPAEWGMGFAKTVTLIVTEDCQLRCKYCYIVGKNSFGKLSFDTAKQTVDYLLENRDVFTESSVIWDFIGGEPLLEIDLIDRISDYIKLRMFVLNHPWFNAYRFNITTNGIMYHDERVQQYIAKNTAHVSLSVTIDGIAAKHNANRVFRNGRGSYDDVIKNIPLWLSQFPDASTKSTVAHDDLPFIRESVLHLWQLGVKYVNMNVVFEDVWHEGDDLLLESELKSLADEVIADGWYREHFCSFFDRSIGKPMDIRRFNGTWCGAGKMLAVDCKGDFFPCIRFADYSLNNKMGLCIGNYRDGVNSDRLRPFRSLDRATQSAQECIDCEVASGCAWCQGANYDFADTDTIFQRATYICKMHKARVRANEYFWKKMKIYE